MNSKLIIFDFNRTLYDPDKKEVIKGVKLVLEKCLKSKIKMVLISKLEKDRENIIKEMGLEKYFNDIMFVREKSEELFNSFLKKYNPQKAYVVGDYLYEEIRSGNMNNMETIWIRNGRFKNMKPRDEHEQPKHTVNNILEILSIIK